MFTADDIKAIRSGTGGAGASSSASSQGFTAADIKKIRSQINMAELNPAPKVAAPKISTPAAPQQTFAAPKSEATPQQKAVHERVLQIAANSNAPKSTVQELRSGRDFAVVPQAKPNADRDAYVADYMKKYPNDPFGKIGAELAYKADSNKALQGAQKLVEATNPIAAIYRTDKALADVANKAINGKPAEPYEVGQHYINKADKARQEFRNMTGNGLASDIALAAGDMLAGAATAGNVGVGLTPYLAATSGIQTAGEDTNKGRELIPSVIHGVGSGGLTYLVGGLGGIGQTKLGQNLVSKITSVPAIKNAIDAASPKVAKYLGDSIAKFIARAGSEGFEEWLEYPAQTLLENIVFDDAAPLDVKQWWNNTLVGFGVGGLFETSNIALNRLANAPVTRVQDGVQIENPAQPEAVQGNVLAPLEAEIKAKREREMQAGEALRVSGIVPNEAANKVNRRTRRAVDAMAKKIGVKVMFDSTLSGEQGSYDPDNREIHIALDSSDPIGVVMTHEITHRMKETSPEQYEQLKNLAFEIMQENGSYDNVLASVADAYGNDAALIEDEMVAHFTRVMTEDIATFERLAGVDRNLAQKIFDLLDELLRKAGWDNNANVALDSLFGDISPQRLQSVRNSWAQALQNADAGAVGNVLPTENGSAILKSKEYWRPDLTKPQMAKLNEWVKFDVKTNTNNIGDAANWTFHKIDGVPVFAIYSTIDENSPTVLYESKGEQAYYERDYLTDFLEGYNRAKSNDGKSNASNRILSRNWVRKTGGTIDYDRASIRGSGGGNVGVLRKQSPKRKSSAAFKSVIGNLLEVRENGSGNVKKSLPLSTAYIDAANRGDTDSTQRMTREAAETAMPNSAIRGKDGKLIPVYHGTNEKFNVFDTSISGGKNGTAEGYGIYTSDNPEVTSAYGDRQIKMYANIKKPARSDKHTITQTQLVKLIEDTCKREAKQLVEDGSYDNVNDALRDTWISNYVYTYDMSMPQAYREVAKSILQMNDNDMEVIQEVMRGLGIRDYAEANKFYRESLTPITGFDGFWAKWENREGGKPSNIILALNSNQLKQADDVTYDDNGNIIPLSERFNPDNPDIRWSRPLDPNAINRKGEILQQLQNAPKQQKSVKMDADLDESIKALMYDIDANEMARRARAAAKSPNEKTAELLSNTGNGIIESESIDDSAQLLGKVTFAANKTISQVLDQAVRGSKGDLPLNKQQMQQLRNNLYNAIEKPLNEAKAKYINGIKSKAGSFAKDMARLGIKPGTKESAAVQWIGEGQRQGPDGEVIEYTLADLQQQFPDKWQNIVEASKICRNIYDAYVNEINDALKLVYPDVEARAAATMDKINARVAYNTNQAQIWLDKAAQLEQRLSAAQAETHSAESMAATKTADRVNRLANQLEAANQTVERYTRAAEAARAKAEDLQRMIDSGEILRNKRLVPRKDYFHHFNEMEQGLGGFVNIISGAHDISAQLAGKSEFTKPKSKWWSALQQRTGGKYTADAVGGMARYIPAAEYKIAFDPFIAQMRGNVEALVNATEKTKNANDLIEYLTDWTNDLAGKTNFLDRPFQKLFSRKSMKALEFLNNRAKANAVAGNLGSAIVQIGNIPNAMMFINNPADWASAAQNIATGNGKEGQSIFLNERYIGNTLDKLQKSSPIKDASNWMLEIGDRQAARLIWNAAYNQFESGRAKGLRQYENAVDYADDITRRAIAGRGVGEMALTQKSRIIKLFDPFQVEVNNTYNLLVEKMGEKDAAALMRYAVGAFAINSLLYVITGRRPLFDPIDALIDAIKGVRDEDEEDERTKGERVAGAISRVGGEVISNMPYASTAATFLTGTENSEKIFGEADPTRYGTGNIAVQTLTEPIGQFINGEKVDLLGPATAILPAYGGKQIERTVRGAQSLGYLPRVDISSSGVDIDRNEFGASRSASGRIRFPITEPADQFKTMLFGEWSTSRGKDYIDKGLQPLSANQSEAMEKAFAAGISPDTYYDALLAARKAVSQKDAKGKTIPLSQDRDKIRLIKEAVPGLTSKEYKLLFEALGISKNAY